MIAYKWRDGAWKIKSCQWDKLSCKNKTQKNCYCSWTKTFHKLENSIQRLAREVLLKHQIRIWDTAASTRNWTNFKSELTKPREEAPEGSLLIESKHRKRKVTDHLKVPKLVTASELKKKRRILWIELMKLQRALLNASCCRRYDRTEKKSSQQIREMAQIYQHGQITEK